MVWKSFDVATSSQREVVCYKLFVEMLNIEVSVLAK